MASSVRSLGRASRSVSRSFHTSVARLLLVGPSDPISHLRPVIYDDVPDSTVSKASTRPVRHPYSLREFDTAADSSIDSADTDHGRYQWKMNSQQLDAFNQQFWTETNTRFEAAKAEILSSLPATTSAEGREIALTNFYQQWGAQERDRQAAYTTEWRKRNWENITLAAKIQYRSVRARLGLH